MTAKELQKRNAKAENLRVLQTEDGSYYVESAEGLSAESSYKLQRVGGNVLGMLQ